MSKTTATRTYGWVPDVGDQRDHFVSVTAPIKLPASVDLRSICPPVYDQGQLGSCSANAIAAAFDIERHIQGQSYMTPSRLFIYYNERVLEHTVSSDSGAQLRDGIKTLRANGAAPESLWPYLIKKFKSKPSAAAFKTALKNEALAYARVPAVESSIKTVLAGGHPVIIGFTVYESFESEQVAETGIMPLPSFGEQAVGGHAVLVVGYKTVNGDPYWIVRNSWGSGWGDAGCFYMPEVYLTTPGLSSDFWTISNVEV
jgi:C1A family cysteine protease